jgi:hypothetical protein
MEHEVSLSYIPKGSDDGVRPSELLVLDFVHCILETLRNKLFQELDMFSKGRGRAETDPVSETLCSLVSGPA